MKLQFQNVLRRVIISLHVAILVVGVQRWDDAGAAEAPPAVSSAWNVYATAQRLVRLPDGRAMNIYCIGRGNPTVLLDAGLGDSAVIWRKVHSRLAEHTQVCAFDRAGYGFSDPGPLPRDAAHIAQDMKAMLEAAGLQPPYVLVGHSLGGLNVRYYAELHLSEIVGMVLVEPATEHQDQRIGRALPSIAELFKQQRAQIQACLDFALGKRKHNPELGEMCKDQPSSDLPPAVNAAAAATNMKPAHLRAELSEFDGIIGSGSDQVAAARRSYDAIPLIVLTAGSPKIPGLSPAQQNTLLGIIKQMHGELAALSTRGVDRLVPGSSHYVQMDNPQAVIDAVEDVLSQVAVR